MICYLFAFTITSDTCYINEKKNCIYIFHFSNFSTVICLVITKCVIQNSKFLSTLNNKNSNTDKNIYIYLTFHRTFTWPSNRVLYLMNICLFPRNFYIFVSLFIDRLQSTSEKLSHYGIFGKLSGVNINVVTLL